jgi:hypothetical protein
VSALLLAVTDDGSRDPGPIPLLIVVLLGIALVLLIRNMNGRLKRLPKEFPPPPERGRPTPPEDGPAGSA